jgi:hypothetical protein
MALKKAEFNDDEVPIFEEALGHLEKRRIFEKDGD